MIGLGTNVLLRAFTDESDPHAPRARRLLEQLAESGETVHVNHIVLCEFAWVLQRSKRLSRAKVAELIELLLCARALHIHEQDAVEEALRTYRASRTDFPDCLIGVLNRRAGCATTYSFDRRAAETADFSPVP
ncbi:PIN domain-containing protein [Benzoatithermus flavus]|uniref:Ribonuclease VapC n=1 Tax=Benzoatithermus flavus TaxID=3108223 RepID=A0ABU8XPD8_9PROT